MPSSRVLTPSTNRVVRLLDAYAIAKHWPFLESAMLALNDPRRAKAGYSPEQFFNMLVRVTLLGNDGLVCLLTSKNGKPLGFGCGFSGEDFNFARCFYVWQAYSNQKCSTALSELLSFCESYARTLGHDCVKTSTPRMSGAADRLFEDILGFKREFYTYSKSIV